ncbi:hypothetical protein SRHO_G00290100 [Serrasalmus rhombeus]
MVYRVKNGHLMVPELPASQRRQASESKSPGAEGTRESRRCRRKTKDHPVLELDDESSGWSSGSQPEFLIPWLHPAARLIPWPLKNPLQLIHDL